MISTANRTDAKLNDALFALSVAKSVPDAEVLDEVIRLYPRHAEALTQFAIDLAMETLRHGDEDMYFPDEPEKVSPAVSRAMSAFHNRLHALGGSTIVVGGNRPAAHAVENPFANLDRTEFRAFADRMHANTVFVSKLRDRLIEAETITEGFRRRAAEELGEPLELLGAHFAARAVARETTQHYKADGKPSAQPKQTFEEAVRSSCLSDDQQRYLLSL